ncbi:MAG: hypothetical protein IT428_06110 [Planctomycetaceae bacterium]|nr:hypothetical protein [Planctomycetaceae bacterium]
MGPLRRLCAVCCVSVSQDLIDAWYIIIGDFHPEVFSAAINEYIRSAKDRFMPMPSEIAGRAARIVEEELKAQIKAAPPCPLKCANGLLAARRRDTGELLPDSVLCGCIRAKQHNGMRFDPRIMETDYRWTAKQGLPAPPSTTAITDQSAAVMGVPPAKNKPARKQIQELVQHTKTRVAGELPGPKTEANGG